MKALENATPGRPAQLPSWLAVVHEAVGNLRYGVIQIKIHDGEVMQIETTQKLRFAAPSPESDSLPAARAEAYPNKPSKATTHQATGGFAKEPRK